MSDEIFALLQSIKQKLDLEIAREALDDIASILQDQHHIRLLSQLKLVEEKSWKNMKGIDPVWKDRMQAEIEGYFGPHRNDDVETKELVEKAGNSARLTEQQVEFHTHHLVSHGFTRLKHFKGLRKPSFYHICSSVLMAQELRKEVKKRLGEKPPETLVEGMTGLSIGTFKLPIVGSLQAKELLAGAQVASVTAHTTFEVSQTTMDRVIRQIDGKIYEYDRLCPHKKADLSQAQIVNGVLICPRHKWRFDLENYGLCEAKGCTINAKVLAW